MRLARAGGAVGRPAAHVRPKSAKQIASPIVLFPLSLAPKSTTTPRRGRSVKSSSRKQRKLVALSLVRIMRSLDRQEELERAPIGGFEQSDSGWMRCLGAGMAVERPAAQQGDAPELVRHPILALHAGGAGDRLAQRASDFALLLRRNGFRPSARPARPTAT